MIDRDILSRPSGMICRFGGLRIPITERLEGALVNINNLIALWRHNGATSISIYLLSELFSLATYQRYAAIASDLLGTNIVMIRVRDYAMLVDIEDLGISRNLLLFGTWEDKLATLFEEELRKLGGELNNGLVVDIGANIGYYALLESTSLGDDAEVLAIEPAKDNARLLERNVHLNGLTERVSIHQGAIGDRTGTAILQRSRRSNLHRIEHERVSDRRGGSHKTQLWTLDEFLRSQGRDPQAVNVVRMDLEGYELEALEGMEEVINGEGPLLLYIEVHNNIFDEEEATRVPELLAAAGFEIRGVERGIVTGRPFDVTFSAQTWEELPAIEKAYGLIAVKE